MFVRRSSVSIAALVLGVALVAHADGPAVAQARHDALLMKQKVAAITAYAGRPSPRPRLTTVTERELNAYLALEIGSELPAGVVDPSISILGTGRLSGRAVVDLDAVRRQKQPTSLLDPMSYLTGRLPLTASGILTTARGVGRFELESASVAGVPIPKPMLQQIVSYYSRSPESPSGISLDNPFPLPAHIREIQVQRGQAVVVQ